MPSADPKLDACQPLHRRCMQSSQNDHQGSHPAGTSLLVQGDMCLEKRQHSVPVAWPCNLVGVVVMRLWEVHPCALAVAAAPHLLVQPSHVRRRHNLILWQVVYVSFR